MTLGDELASVLPALQAAAVSLMRDTCTVTRKSSEWVTDADGVEYQPDVTVYQGPCKVQSESMYASTGESVGAVKVTQVYHVHFPVGSPVGDGDLVTVEGRALPLRLTGSHDKTIQTAMRIQASEESNSGV